MVANGCRLQTSNFCVTINSNKRVILVDQLNGAYFKCFDTAWKSYFDQSPDVWLKFLAPGDSREQFQVHRLPWPGWAEFQSSRHLIYAHMLIEVKLFTKTHIDINKFSTHMETVPLVCFPFLVPNNNGDPNTQADAFSQGS